MILAQHTAIDLEDLLVHLERLFVLPLLIEDPSNVFECKGNIWMFLPVHAALDSERLLEFGHRLSQHTNQNKKTAKVCERRGNL